jgi:hypothetical protein
VQKPRWQQKYPIDPAVFKVRDRPHYGCLDVKPMELFKTCGRFAAALCAVSLVGKITPYCPECKERMTLLLGLGGDTPDYHDVNTGHAVQAWKCFKDDIGVKMLILPDAAFKQEPPSG